MDDYELNLFSKEAYSSMQFNQAKCMVNVESHKLNANIQFNPIHLNNDNEMAYT